MKLYKIWKRGKIVESPYPGLYVGVRTTKVFGKLNCKSGMRAKKENRIFFHFWNDAVKAGIRPCKNCKPIKLQQDELDLRQKLDPNLWYGR